MKACKCDNPYVFHASEPSQFRQKGPRSARRPYDDREASGYGSVILHESHISLCGLDGDVFPSQFEWPVVRESKRLSSTKLYLSLHSGSQPHGINLRELIHLPQSPHWLKFWSSSYHILLLSSRSSTPRRHLTVGPYPHQCGKATITKFSPFRVMEILFTGYSLHDQKLSSIHCH